MTEEELKAWKIKKKVEMFEERHSGELTADEYRIALQEIDMIS